MIPADCRAERRQAPGTAPAGRVIRCGLPDDHGGRYHAELETGVVWLTDAGNAEGLKFGDRVRFGPGMTGRYIGVFEGAYVAAGFSIQDGEILIGPVLFDGPEPAATAPVPDDPELAAVAEGIRYGATLARAVS